MFASLISFGQEFSAKYVMTGASGSTGMLYVSGSQMRTDVVHNERAFVVLLDAAKKTEVTILNVQDRTFWAMDLKRQPEAAAKVKWLFNREKQFCDSPEVRSCKFVGLQSMNRRTCDQYVATYADGTTHEVCFDQQLHFPVLDATASGRSEISDMKLGKQPRWLFLVPRDYHLNAGHWQITP
jgi:hypothetical protein